jgi:hypothetical protein
VQAEEARNEREERDVTETETMLALVGVEQPAVLYRVDAHRWTYAPFAESKVQSSMNPSAPPAGSTQANSEDNGMPAALADAETPSEVMKPSMPARQVALHFHLCAGNRQHLPCVNLILLLLIWLSG